MMKWLTKNFPISLILFLLIFQNVFASNGTCGKNVSWVTDDSGTITFTRTGSGESYWSVSNNAEDSSDCSYIIKSTSGITDVVVSSSGGKIPVTNGNELFDEIGSVRTMDLTGLDVSGVTDMSGMFRASSDLTALDLSGWDTSSAVNMHSMFLYCYALKDLDLTGWTTSAVTDMMSMFMDCTSLTDLDLSGWDTSKVTTMREMFRECYALKSLNMSGWDTSKVTNMRDMFNGCRSLPSLDVSGFDISNAREMGRMFSGCSSLTDLNMSTWHTFSSYTDISAMFMYCDSLIRLDLSSWDTSNVTDFGAMFTGPVSTLVLGEKTMEKNILSSLLYNREEEEWRYEESADGLADPLPVGTVKKLSDLVNQYDPDTMAGTWTQVNGKITFDSNGGEGEMDPQKVSFNTPIELVPNTFTWEGRTFSSWNTRGDGSGDTYLDQETVTLKSNLYLFAQWVMIGQETDVDTSQVKVSDEVKTAIEDNSDVTGVTLDETNGGVQALLDAALANADEEQKAAVAEAADLELIIIVNIVPTVFEDGKQVTYTLAPTAALIAKNDEGSVTAAIEGISVSNDLLDQTKDIKVTVYIGFQPEQIIHRDDNGKIIEVFTKDQFGYDASTGAADVIIHRFSELTALADPLTVTVTFDKNSSDASGSMDPQKFAYGTAKKLTANGFTLAGHVFTGWNTAPDGTGTDYADQAEIIDLTEDMTLYAQWKRTSGDVYSIPFFSLLSEGWELPKTGFSSHDPVQLPARPQGLSYGSLALRLQIPRFDVETELVRIPLTEDGWPVEWLGNQAGVLEGSALPGEGYSLVVAHNTLNDLEYGPFALLSLLEAEDTLFVRTDDNELSLFRVYDNTLIDPADFETISAIAAKEPGSMILITCENESMDGTYLNRRVVFARPL